ncbi:MULTISPECIES: hypothetical protein [Planococcus]|uniref:Uncharacterized protein n=2 Tax=Planococcus TaxID=1372 RepID=A0A0U2XQE7_9BACL|nr:MULTISPECIES: hypothetical protein [Planococcus]ALS74776.1 hypothetical protein AUC31_05860 [Planococcus rifietoensis]RLJ86813.1 hypothetical protein DFR62_2416 [Planococcus citreus]
MTTAHELNRLSDEAVYSILYFYHIEEFPAEHLGMKYGVSSLTIEGIAKGRYRPKCHENFMIVEGILERRLVKRAESQ